MGKPTTKEWENCWPKSVCEYTQLTVVVVVVVVVELYHTAIYVTIGWYLSIAMIGMAGVTMTALTNAHHCNTPLLLQC